MELQGYLNYLAAFLFVLALIGLLAWGMRFFVSRTSYRNNRGPEISIIETKALDAKRRLILIRRKDTEHLLLVGGANDLVIETGIRSEVNEGSDDDK